MNQVFIMRLKKQNDFLLELTENSNKAQKKNETILF